MLGQKVAAIDEAEKLVALEKYLVTG